MLQAGWLAICSPIPPSFWLPASSQTVKSLLPCCCLGPTSAVCLAPICLQLIRLAQALGRRMVIPNPPCDSVWIGVWNTTQNRHEEGERAALESGELTLWPSYFDGFQVGSCLVAAVVLHLCSLRLSALVPGSGSLHRLLSLALCTSEILLWLHPDLGMPHAVPP